MTLSIMFVGALAAAGLGFFSATVRDQAIMWQMREDHRKEIERLTAQYNARLLDLAKDTQSAASKTEENTQKLEKAVEKIEQKAVTK